MIVLLKDVEDLKFFYVCEKFNKKISEVIGFK